MRRVKLTSIGLLCIFTLLFQTSAAFAVPPKMDLHEIIARAQTAVGTTSAYTQGNWYTWGAEGWTPYEGDIGNDGVDDQNGADCSGYVLKSWQVPYSMSYQLENPSTRYTTSEFYYNNTYWYEISRSSMQQGDIFVRDGHTFIYHQGDAWGQPLVFEAAETGTRMHHISRSADSSYKVKRRSYLYNYDGKMILDNPSATYWQNSGWNNYWTTSTSETPYWGDNYSVFYGPNATNTTAAKWIPYFRGSGYFNVYVHWTAHSNRATQAKYIVRDANGATTKYRNQTVDYGDDWSSLGTYYFNQGYNITNGSVTLFARDDTDGYVANGYVSADVVMFEWDPDQNPNTTPVYPNDIWY